MFYAVANPSWTPGESLTPPMARSGLSRWRPKAEDVANGGPILAIALRYDATRGLVIAEGPTARGVVGPWSAPAIVDLTGNVMVLAPIPPALVQVVGTAEIRVHPDSARVLPRAHIAAGRPATGRGRARLTQSRSRSHLPNRLAPGEKPTPPFVRIQRAGPTTEP